MKAHVDNKHEMDLLDEEISVLAGQINDLRCKLARVLHRKNILEYEQEDPTSSANPFDRRVQKAD
jgi:hypothetical protein